MQSMTGFGRAEQVVGSTQYTVELRSVNHRYLDIRFRLPPTLQMFESVFTECVRARLQRGSLDVSIRQRLAAPSGALESSTRFVVDEKAAQSFVAACKILHEKHGTPAIPSIETMQATGKIFLSLEETQEATTLPPAIRAVFEKAVDALVVERKREGEKTCETLVETTASLKALVDQARALSGAHPSKIREKLEKRIEQWALSGNLDAARLATEVAFYAERADIAEEIQRFEAHLEEFSKLLKQPQPVGRKLDFLTQELHRETNTIASKADDLGLSRLAVEAKTAIEKLREQVQNVE